jgi:uncharacterized protein involved in tolerance to divalent cations
MEPRAFQVQVAVDSESGARRMLETVMTEQLTVSARIAGPILSASWREGTNKLSECWIIEAMVTVGRVSALTQRFIELHPDRDAEIVAVPVVGGNYAYLSQVTERSW